MCGAGCLVRGLARDLTGLIVGAVILGLGMAPPPSHAPFRRVRTPTGTMSTHETSGIILRSADAPHVRRCVEFVDCRHGACCLQLAHRAALHCTPFFPRWRLHVHNRTQIVGLTRDYWIWAACLCAVSFRSLLRCTRLGYPRAARHVSPCSVSLESAAPAHVAQVISAFLFQASSLRRSPRRPVFLPPTKLCPGQRAALPCSLFTMAHSAERDGRPVNETAVATAPALCIYRHALMR
jgi:hypothetical protein